jgi:hypothetical protein
MRTIALVGCLFGLVCSTTLAYADFHVSLEGSDENSGTADEPFRTLERARDAVREVKARDGILEGGLRVVVHPGTYAVAETFALGAEDGGSAGSPVTYRAAGAGVVLSGGVELEAFASVSDAAVLARLPEAAREHVLEADPGDTDMMPLVLGGFASGRGFQTHPVMELFVDGKAMTLARWPNAGFVEMGEVLGTLDRQHWNGRKGSSEGRFRFEEERLARWAEEPDAWLYGYWFWDWADSYEQVASIDAAAEEITLAEPWHRYGYREGQRFYGVNLLSELDAPGEWYLDRARGKVYLYPEKDLDDARVVLSATAAPLVRIDGASHVRLEGLMLEYGTADGIQVQGGGDIRIQGCVVRHMAGDGVVVNGGREHAVRSCDIYSMGRGAIRMAGGDRKTLARGDHVVENCHIHHLSRIDHTYTPGVWLDGVGNTIRHNEFHDIASSAMRVEGNEHLIELNEVHHVVLESEDQGGVDMFGNATYRGNVYRHNYFHHIGNVLPGGDTSHVMRAGIRLDDAICGVLIEGNVFHQCAASPSHFGGVQIHGGKENLVTGNLFVDCGAAVSFSPWGEKRWKAFVEDALDAPAIDRDLYLERYPALAELAEGHDENTVRDNAVVRCKELFLRAPGTVRAENNRVLDEQDVFLETPDGRLDWRDQDAAALGVGEIPFEAMGLREDTWRTRADGRWTLDGARD